MLYAIVGQGACLHSKAPKLLSCLRPSLRPLTRTSTSTRARFGEDSVAGTPFFRGGPGTGWLPATGTRLRSEAATHVAFPSFLEQ